MLRGTRLTVAHEGVRLWRVMGWGGALAEECWGLTSCPFTGRWVNDVCGVRLCDPLDIGGSAGICAILVTVTEGQDDRVGTACLEWSWH